MPESNIRGAGGRRAFLKGAAAAALGSGLLRPAAAWQADPTAPRKIIIDTDPGTDDALAIFLAFRSPELKIEGITPVAGNVPLELTLPNALRLVEIGGRTDIPVATGADRPLVRRLITASYAHGENGLGGVQFPDPVTKPVAESAPQLIRRIVRASPGQVTIVALGPLTNLALAFRADPELPRMVQSIVIMGGSLSGGNVTPSAEFNIYVDPEAAQAVFRAGAPLVMVGLDVTRRAVLREEHIQALESGASAISRAAGRITRATMDRIRKSGSNGGPVMHDSLALAAFLDPGVVTLRDYYVEVETAGEYTAGETLGYTRAPLRRSAPMANAPAPVPDPMKFQPNCKVAVDLDAERFFKLLIGRLAQ